MPRRLNRSLKNLDSESSRIRNSTILEVKIHFFIFEKSNLFVEVKYENERKDKILEVME